jgi:Haemolysin-type calcium binding protein related domain
VLKDWYLGTQYHVEQFMFASGSVLSDSQVQGLVSAMGAFAPATASIEPVMRNNASNLMFNRMDSLAVQAI